MVMDWLKEITDKNDATYAIVHDEKRNEILDRSLSENKNFQRLGLYFDEIMDSNAVMFFIKNGRSRSSELDRVDVLHEVSFQNIQKIRKELKLYDDEKELL